MTTQSEKESNVKQLGHLPYGGCPKAAPFFEILLHAREAEHHADHGGNADENDWVQVFGLFDAAREEEQRQRKDDAAPVERTVP